MDAPCKEYLLFPGKPFDPLVFPWCGGDQGYVVKQWVAVHRCIVYTDGMKIPDRVLVKREHLRESGY